MLQNIADLQALTLLLEPVRRRIYDWVVEQGRTVRRDEVAEAAGIGQPLATFHLERLVRAGLLVAEYRRAGSRTGPGAGRPAKWYRRGDREFIAAAPPRRYDLVSQLMAKTMGSEAGKAVRPRLNSVARGLGLELGRSSRPESAGPDGLGPLLSVLGEVGYEPKARDGEVRLANCPFKGLVSDHREVVCPMNVALCEGVLAGLGSSELTAVYRPARDWCCVVFVRAPAGQLSQA